MTNSSCSMSSIVNYPMRLWRYLTQSSTIFDHQQSIMLQQHSDVLALIMDKLLLPDLIRLGRTCQQLYQFVQYHLHCTVSLTLLIGNCSPEILIHNATDLEKQHNHSKCKLDSIHKDTLTFDRNYLNALLRALPRISKLTIALHGLTSTQTLPALCYLMESWSVNSLRFYYRLSDRLDPVSLTPNIRLLLYTINNRMSSLRKLVLCENSYHGWRCEYRLPVLAQLASMYVFTWKSLVFDHELEPLTLDEYVQNLTQFAQQSSHLREIWMRQSLPIEELEQFPRNFATKFRSLSLWHCQDLLQLNQLCNRFYQVTVLFLFIGNLTGISYHELINAISPLTHLRKLMLPWISTSTFNQNEIARQIDVLPKVTHFHISLAVYDCEASFDYLHLFTVFPALAEVNVRFMWLGSAEPRPCKQCRQIEQVNHHIVHDQCRAKIEQTLRAQLPVTGVRVLMDNFVLQK